MMKETPDAPTGMEARNVKKRRVERLSECSSGSEEELPPEERDYFRTRVRCPPLELLEKLVVEFSGGAALGKLGQCSKRMKDICEKRSSAALASVTALRRGQEGVGDWSSDAQMLWLYTDTPNLLTLFVTDTPLSRYAVPRWGLLRFLSKQRTDYRKPEHRAYALKTALRYGDAALIEAILGRMTPSERLENKLEKKKKKKTKLLLLEEDESSSPRGIEEEAFSPSFEKEEDSPWYSAHTTAADLYYHLSVSRFKSRHFRRSPRPAPISRDLCTSMSEQWRDAIDKDARGYNKSNSDRWQSWIDGGTILFRYIRDDKEEKATAFVGASDRTNLRSLVDRWISHGDFKRARQCLAAIGVSNHDGEHDFNLWIPDDEEEEEDEDEEEEDDEEDEGPPPGLTLQQQHYIDMAGYLYDHGEYH